MSIDETRDALAGAAARAAAACWDSVESLKLDGATGQRVTVIISLDLADESTHRLIASVDEREEERGEAVSVVAQLLASCEQVCRDAGIPLAILPVGRDE